MYKLLSLAIHNNFLLIMPATVNISHKPVAQSMPKSKEIYLSQGYEQDDASQPEVIRRLRIRC